MLLTIMPEWTLQFVITVLGAFFGAASAFTLENLRRKRAESEKTYANLVQAFLALRDKYFILYGLQKTYLDPYRHQEERFKLMPQAAVSFADTKIDYASLNCLIEKDRLDLRDQIFAAEQSYEATMALLSKLNDCIEESTLEFYTDVETGEVKQRHNPDKLHMLEAMVDALYEVADASTEQLGATVHEIAEFAYTHYPSRKKLELKSGLFEVDSQSMNK